MGNDWLLSGARAVREIETQAAKAAQSSTRDGGCVGQQDDVHTVLRLARGLRRRLEAMARQRK